jgi:non-ribosomal peptide synthase protein (TIGR01720 family)
VQKTDGRSLTKVDVTKTIGWFIQESLMPLDLHGGTIDAQIAGIKEQVKGFSYDKALSRSFVDNMASAKENKLYLNEIKFNYTGRFYEFPDNNLFNSKNILFGMEIDGGNLMTAKLEFIVQVVNEQLVLQIFYNDKAYLKSTITSLIKLYFTKLEDILDHIRLQTSIQFTPSDFSVKELDQAELDSLFE